MAELNGHYTRSNARVIGFCATVGLLAVTQGLDVAQTSGFLAMPRYEITFIHCGGLSLI
jgi:hypothetical protein